MASPGAWQAPSVLLILPTSQNTALGSGIQGLCFGETPASNTGLYSQTVSICYFLRAFRERDRCPNRVAPSLELLGITLIRQNRCYPVWGRDTAFFKYQSLLRQKLKTRDRVGLPHANRISRVFECLNLDWAQMALLSLA
jgi:hypothetical protein